MFDPVGITLNEVKNAIKPVAFKWRRGDGVSGWFFSFFPFRLHAHASPFRLQEQHAAARTEKRGGGELGEPRTFHVASHKVREQIALLREAALLRYLLIFIALIKVYYISRHFSASELKESFILERVSTG